MPLHANFLLVYTSYDEVNGAVRDVENATYLYINKTKYDVVRQAMIKVILKTIIS